MHPESRAMFRTTSAVPYDVHLRLVDEYFQRDSSDCWFLIEAAGQPVGAISLLNFDQEGAACEAGQLVIAPEQRGNGYAGRAFKLLLEYARSIGVCQLYCEVLASNAIVIRLTRSLGFVDMAVRAEGGRSFIELSCDLRSLV
jgi:RimJ/RimL family protein N-acetyltransferase